MRAVAGAELMRAVAGGATAFAASADPGLR